ncbi:MAG TPA: LuxR C-terminal-related transcriptional regulator [Pseudonocardiaceae bacterium]|nr:LuxR C-terminal-related transcriptional regulator [Pseudonocardiaceae bacterium]
MLTGPIGCVGRDPEISELVDNLHGTVADGAMVAAVLGPPGVGKTALLRALTARHDGHFWAQATPWETDLSGGVLAQLVQKAMPDDPLDAATVLVDLLRAVKPALVLIDDAEHADRFSVQAISTLVRHHRDLPVLFVIAATALGSSLADLATTRLHLSGLSESAVAALAAARGRTLHPTVVGTLTRQTAGNPGDILELLDEVPEAVWSQPDAVLPPTHRRRQLTRDQLDACSPEGRALVEALAVLGREGSLAGASALAGLPDPLPAVDSANAAGLLFSATPFEPRLRDAATRVAVLDLMGVHAVAQAHRHAAGMVADPVARLRHLVAATSTPDPVLAADVARLAHDQGAEGAWAQAATLFRDAARLTADPLVRDEHVARSVDALIAAGDCVAAAAKVPAVENLRETPLRNAVLAYLAIQRGRGAEAEVRLGRAWEIVNIERDPAMAALVAQRHVPHSLIRCRGEEVVTWADRALSLADSDSPAGIESAAIRGLGLLAAGHPRRAAAAYDDLSVRVPHGPQAQRVVMGRGWVQFIGDDIDGARTSLESAAAAAGMGGSRRITLWALAWLARVHFAVGEWDRAISVVEQGRALARASGIVVTTPLLEWTAAQIAALRGDWPAATAAVRASSAGAGDYEMMVIPNLLAQAQIAEAEADYAKVCRIVAPLTRMASGTSLQEPGYWPWPDLLGNALVIDGQLQAADAFLGPHEQRAEARGHRSAQARLGYARGRLHGARGDIHSARRSFEAALDLLSGLPLRYDIARVNFAFGQTLRRAGKRRQADIVISTAREIYLSLGAHTYVARCDRELKAGGLNQVRGSRDDVQLTPQEEAVSTLVAQGLSNREVAAELFVSTKTVQYHLTRIYAKLGVRSRSELAALRR